jgi:cytochrome P450
MDTIPSTANPLTDEWCLHHFDHLSADLPGLLPDTLARMRSLCPVARSEEHGGFWVATAYGDVLRVAQDWETFSSAHGLTVPASPIAVRNIPVEVDPPLHRVYKRLINAYFTPDAVAPWEPATRRLVTRLIDDFIESGRCEFMQAVARSLPAQSFFEVALGAPRGEIEKVAYMASKSSIPNDPEAAECWLGLSNWIAEFLETRRGQPQRGDVVDGVLKAEIEGRPITHEEIVGTIQLLILGGLETTAGALGMMMVRLCNDPETSDLLRHRPDLLPEAVEELLRLDSPFIAITRTATRDIELGGQQIKEGDKVIIYWASANRDEAEFPDPNEFSLERGSNRHLSFGAGPHRCAGSNLARMNLRVALAELLGRLHNLKLEKGAEIHYHSTFTRTPLAVPITFTPGPKVGDR